MLTFKLIDYAQLSYFRRGEMVRSKLRDDQWERIQQLDGCYLAFVMRASILVCLA